MATSPRLSFKGYKLSEALYRNKDTLKLVLAAVTGYSTYLGTTGSFDIKAFLISVGAAVGVVASKLLYDAFDYFFSEVEL